MITLQPVRAESTGVTTLEDEPMVFHCNHYNRFLQLVVEDCHYIRHEPILQDSAAEIAYRQLSSLFFRHSDWTITQRLEAAESIYRYCGFGDLELVPAVKGFDANPLFLREKHSHYGMALRLNYGKRKRAGEFFDTGFAVGALAAALEQPVRGEIVSRVGEEPISMGGTESQFALFPNEPNERFPIGTPNYSEAVLPPEAQEVAPRSFALHVDEDSIIQAVASMPLVGNAEGLIPAFGVTLTRHYADYYNLVSFRFERALANALSTHKYLAEMLWYEYPSLFFYKDKFSHLQGQALARTLLIEAGHICGFNTMGGIMRSDPWYQLVVPQLRQREDWLAGIIACINALGWGIWRITELVPNERLILRAWHPYESLGHLRAFGRSEHPIDYLMTGIGASLMNLLYTADITKKPDLTLEFYYQANRSRDGFWAHQTRCVAMGDPYSEIIVERNVL